jgi:hypothetical protein
LNHFPGVLDAISWDAAAMSVTQKEASRLSKLNGTGSLGDTGAQQQEQGRSDGEIWTHGNSKSNTSPMNWVIASKRFMRHRWVDGDYPSNPLCS